MDFPVPVIVKRLRGLENPKGPKLRKLKVTVPVVVIINKESSVSGAKILVPLGAVLKIVIDFDPEIVIAVSDDPFVIEFAPIQIVPPEATEETVEVS